MLSNINISNLENSNNESSIYSDACENSIQLEQEYKKLQELELNKQKKEDVKNSINENNDINVNKIENFKILDKFLENNDLGNKNFSRYELNESYSNNQSLFNKNNMNNNNNEFTKEIKEKKLNNRYILNKNINCNNINKIKLSNVNIIINNNNNREKEEKVNNKYNNSESNENINENLSNKSTKSIKQFDKENDKNNIVINEIKNDIKKEENLGNNSGINGPLTKNINNSELFVQNLKKNSLQFSSTSNLDFNIFNDFGNVTIITKRKKKGTSNNVSKSTVLNPNKSISFSVNDNSMASNKCKFENISYNQIDLNYLKHLRIIFENIIRITTFFC